MLKPESSISLCEDESLRRTSRNSADARDELVQIQEEFERLLTTVLLSLDSQGLEEMATQIAQRHDLYVSRPTSAVQRQFSHLAY